MRPESILPVVKGMTRDYAVDALPAGFVWDMKDFIPQRRGTRMESRESWSRFSAVAFGAISSGGYYARFSGGIEKLMTITGQALYDINIQTGTWTQAASVFTGGTTQNGVMLRDRIYFPPAATNHPFGVVTYAAPNLAWAYGPGTAPASSRVAAVYKDRLVLGRGADIFFSPLEVDGGPLGTWDALSKIGIGREVTGLAAMPGKLICFHPGRTSRVIGSIPPGANLDTDMYVDTMSEQVGCTEPRTICTWNENVCWADERGVFMSDGATIRNLTELGGIADFWRDAYQLRVQGQPSVAASVYFDYLIVSIVGTTSTVCLLCDLNTRAWFRFSNFPAVVMIPSEGSFEEVYAIHEPARHIVRVSPMFAGSMLTESFESLLSGEIAPFALSTANMVDGDGTAVLPSFETGWERLGSEGRKQVKHAFLSYRHQSYEQPGVADAVEVLYRKDPAATTDLGAYASLGKVPSVGEYTRKRLPVGGKYFGIQVKVQAVKPFRIFSVSDLGIGITGNDRGKVSA